MINNIQSLRFFAAMAVFMVHVAPRYKSMTPSMEVFDYFTLFGQSGVDIFFVISGYIMWHSTRKLHGCMDSTFFAMNRLARIFTGYWPFFILYFVYLFYLNIDALVDVDVLKSFLLIPQSRNKNLIGVTWTLFFELYFYLFMAFLVLTTREKALRILVFVGLFFLFLNIYKYLTMSNAELANFSYFQFLTSPYIVEFIAGCFAWELIKRETFSSYRSFVILGLLLILFGAWFNYEIMDRTIFHGYHRLYRVAIFGTAAFFLVYGLVGIEKQGHTLKHKLWINLY